MPLFPPKIPHGLLLGWGVGGGGDPRIGTENSSTKRLHIIGTIVPLLCGWIRLYNGVMTDIPSLLVL